MLSMVWYYVWRFRKIIGLGKTKKIELIVLGGGDISILLTLLVWVVF